MKSRIASIVILFVVLLAVMSGAASADRWSTPQPAPSSAAWCGRLSSYTTSYWSTVERIWKPILYVWKGQGRGNPYAMSVWYNGLLGGYVPNADDGIRMSSPQVDNGSGWVGYFIAKRWYLIHPSWDDDWRWEVRACLP